MSHFTLYILTFLGTVKLGYSAFMPSSWTTSSNGLKNVKQFNSKNETLVVDIHFTSYMNQEEALNLTRMVTFLFNAANVDSINVFLTLEKYRQKRITGIKLANFKMNRKTTDILTSYLTNPSLEIMHDLTVEGYCDANNFYIQIIEDFDGCTYLWRIVRCNPDKTLGKDIGKRFCHDAPSHSSETEVLTRLTTPDPSVKVSALFETSKGEPITSSTTVTAKISYPQTKIKRIDATSASASRSTSYQDETMRSSTAEILVISKGSNYSERTSSRAHDKGTTAGITLASPHDLTTISRNILTPITVSSTYSVWPSAEPGQTNTSFATGNNVANTKPRILQQTETASLETKKFTLLSKVLSTSGLSPSADKFADVPPTTAQEEPTVADDTVLGTDQPTARLETTNFPTVIPFQTSEKSVKTTHSVSTTSRKRSVQQYSSEAPVRQETSPLPNFTASAPSKNDIDTAKADEFMLSTVTGDFLKSSQSSISPQMSQKTTKFHETAVNERISSIQSDEQSTLTPSQIASSQTIENLISTNVRKFSQTYTAQSAPRSTITFYPGFQDTSRFTGQSITPITVVAHSQTNTPAMHKELTSLTNSASPFASISIVKTRKQGSQATAYTIKHTQNVNSQETTNSTPKLSESFSTATPNGSKDGVGVVNPRPNVETEKEPESTSGAYTAIVVIFLLALLLIAAVATYYMWRNRKASAADVQAVEAAPASAASGPEKKPGAQERGAGIKQREKDAAVQTKPSSTQISA